MAKGDEDIRVMTPEIVAQCEGLFARGMSVANVAKHAGIGESTLRKALGRGAVRKPSEGFSANAADDDA